MWWISFWNNYTNFLSLFDYKVPIYPDPMSRNLRMHTSETCGPANRNDKHRTAADTLSIIQQDRPYVKEINNY
jgi:hypothetical protein